MKIKVAITFLAIAAVVVAAFAFTPKRIPITQYLDESDVASVVIGSLQNDVADPGNWTTTPPWGLTFSNGSKLAAIIFNQESSSDGSGDGQLSKTEAVQAVYNYYVANSNTLPADNNSISVSVSGSSGSAALDITIRRKN
jgi:hypothetical protein